MSGGTSIDDLLIAHAAGRLAEPVAMLVATHLALSPASRRRYRRYEALGGAFLDGIEPDGLDPCGLDRVMARLDEPADAGADAGGAAATPSSRLPLPLRDYVPDGIERLRWRRYGPVAEAEIALAAPGYRTRLFRLAAGRAVPRHTHEGSELTLVLDGAFSDGRGHWRRGDLAIADGTVDHRPRADADRDCLCLAVTDAPVRLTGSVGRFLNPFIRI